MAINGTVVILKINDEILHAQTDSTISFENQIIETSSKTSGRFTTYIDGKIDSTASFTARYDDQPTGSNLEFSDIFGLLKTGGQVDVYFGQTATGKKAYTSKAVISSLELTAADNEAAEISGELQLTGEVSEVTVA